MNFLNRLNIEVINEEDYEKCVICHELTDEKKDTNIELRSFYVEGVGQLCPKCYQEIYNK